ncbi:MAG TPA: hydrogenase nickel incorporation protein HypB [Longimicrobiales bacterium]|nr:hydrogenase nickel incorporation protein HypB [Longimicrobiales bacterium]
MAVRRITVRERVMARNDEIAADVRARLARHGVRALNLVSSPGAGKTTLLERTLYTLGDDLGMAVVTGDVRTANDAERLERHTDRLVQAVVTGGACHLDASQVAEALDALDLDALDVLFIENVGNLVCPAAWDLGEAAKIVLFSVTEGEDKPSKYPRAFSEATHVVLTKTDLLPYVPFDPVRARALALEVNPALEWIEVSALTGDGLQGWFDCVSAATAPRIAGIPV